MYWTTSLGACDVEDKDSLKQFRRKRAEWLDWIDGGDRHDISTQLWLMTRSYIAFRIMNEARRLVFQKNIESPIRNNLLFEFSTTGFVTTQALAVRRLDEMEAKDPARQIISLRRLVTDMQIHSKLFTRENFVGFDGAPYDPEPAKTRWLQRLQDEAPGSPDDVACHVEEYKTSGSDAWLHSEQLHCAFDDLSGVQADKRTRSDVIPGQVFKSLVRTIDCPSIQRARGLANKTIAHAATLDSRARSVFKNPGISFNDIDLAHKALITAAQFVSAGLLSETNLQPVPTPQYDPFEHLDAGGFDVATMRRLRRLANVLAQRRKIWADGAHDAVLYGGLEEWSPRQARRSAVAR